MFEEVLTMTPEKPGDGPDDLPERAAAFGARSPAPVALVSGASEVAAHLERHLALCRRHRSGLALLCVSVVDVRREGAAVGPELERQVRDEVAHRLRGRVRASDHVLRESDRDACVLLPGASDDAVERVARRFERALNGDYRVANELVQVRVRIGCATHPADGGLAGELVRAAQDRATAREP